MHELDSKGLWRWRWRCRCWWQPAGEMEMIPVPKDKAQLARMVSMGYTVHENHMHPPGVKSCPLDKAGGSIIG